MVIQRILFVVAFALSCASARAQTASSVSAGFGSVEVTPGDITYGSEDAAADAGDTHFKLDGPLTSALLRSSTSQSTLQSGRRDSLWNGALIGAGLGGMIGAFAGLAAIDCSECAGFNVPLTFGVLGAGIGVGLGAGIDHLHSSRAASPQRQPRVQLSPLVTRKTRGVMAWVHF